MRKNLLLLLVPLFFLTSCGEKKDPDAPTDTLSSGTVQISVDETYRPVIEEQKKVFDSSYPNAHVQVNYTTEQGCFEDLMSKKSRLILVTREVLPAEKQQFLDRKIVTHSLQLARDGIAVVLNNESAESLFALPQLQGILTGENKSGYTVVVDNAASSTVRFLIDSVLAGKPLGSNVYAAKSADSVIAYVKSNPKAIGFVGVPYVVATDDSLRTDVKIASLKNDSTGEFLKPYTAYVALRTYLLTRTLYFVSRETTPGLGTGFANFLSKERGQLLFYHFGMFPLQLNVVIRDASINPASP